MIWYIQILQFSVYLTSLNHANSRHSVMGNKSKKKNNLLGVIENVILNQHLKK